MSQVRPRAVAALGGAGLAAVIGLAVWRGNHKAAVAPPPTTVVTAPVTSTPAAATTTTAGPFSAGPTSTPATTAPGAPAASDLRLDLHGVGPVRIGMTVAQASAALGRALQNVNGATGDACTIYAPEGGPDGLALLVTSGTVARADIVGGPITTADGVAVGMTEAEALRRLGASAQVTPNPNRPGGHLLTVVPAAPADAGFRLVAETDGAVVTALRAGKLPEVGFAAGCS